uniref:Uncharacterized protein n=1 Tax=Rhizophora mucronata TaxID=61149 RepID=A0A2P2QTZ3_RHIMU
MPPKIITRTLFINSRFIYCEKAHLSLTKQVQQFYKLICAQIQSQYHGTNCSTKQS